MVKQLNVSFDDNEFNEIEKIKNKSNKSWHDFLLELIIKEKQ